MSERRVLLLGWDGLDWGLLRRLAASGKLPLFARLLREGTCFSLERFPFHSRSAWWTSAATGVWPHEHGIIGPGALDAAARRLRAHESADRRCPAIWNLMAENDLECHVLGWPGTGPVESISGVFLPREWAQSRAEAVDIENERNANSTERVRALEPCRARVEDLDPRLLGLFLDSPSDAVEAYGDARSVSLFRQLARLYTWHNTAMALIEEAADGAGGFRMLALHHDFPAAVTRIFEEPCPSDDRSEPRNQRLFRKVMEGAYRLLDLLLTEMLAAAGSETCLALASSGWHPPRAAGAHALSDLPVAAEGHILLFGGGIRAGVRPHRAKVVDIAPTLLHLLNVTSPNWMAGRAWAEVEHSQRRVERFEGDMARVDLIRSGETHSDSSKIVTEEELVAIRCATEHELGLSFMCAGQAAAAVGCFARAMVMRPEEPQYGYRLAQALYACGLHREALAALAGLEDRAEDDPIIRLHLAGFALRCGDLEMARGYLAHPGNPPREVGKRPAEFLLLDALLRYFEGDSATAELLCREALALKPVMAEGWLGLAKVLIKQTRYAEAGAAARMALRRSGMHAEAHWILAGSAAGLGHHRAAMRHAAMAIRDEPGQVAARQLLVEHFPQADPALRAQLTRIMRQAGDERGVSSHQQAKARVSLTAALGGTHPVRLRASKETLLLTGKPVVGEAGSELWSRVRTFLNCGKSRVADGWRFWVAGCGRPLRIVAAIGLEPCVGSNAATLHLKALSSHRQAALIGELVRPAEVSAYEEGCRVLQAIQPVPSRLAELLESADYRRLRTDSWWLGRREVSLSRLRQAQRLSERLGRTGLKVVAGPLMHDDLDTVEEILSAHHLFSLQRCQLVGMLPAGLVHDDSSGAENANDPECGGLPDSSGKVSHDPELSTVLRVGGKVVAVQLVQRLAEDLIFVHARAVHPDFMCHSGELSVHLLSGFLNKEFGAINRCVFSGEVGMADETIRLARRFGAETLGCYGMLRKDLTGQG